MAVRGGKRKRGEARGNGGVSGRWWGGEEGCNTGRAGEETAWERAEVGGGQEEDEDRARGGEQQAEVSPHQPPQRHHHHLKPRHPLPHAPPPNPTPLAPLLSFRSPSSILGSSEGLRGSAAIFITEIVSKASGRNMHTCAVKKLSHGGGGGVRRAGGERSGGDRGGGLGRILRWSWLMVLKVVHGVRSSRGRDR